MESIARTQRPSCSAATQAKAQRLEVLDLTRRLAIVKGDHGEYYVDMLNMICSCKAGRDGLRCSHCMAALIQRSQLQGYGDVRFFDDRLDAKVACVGHLKAGRRARVTEDNGYVFVECQTPPIPPRRFAVYDPTTGDLAVWERGRVIGHVQTYTEMEALRG